uniref:Uncharacterized protein n=1 Tax=Oryza punctata TaxID=4537 RepID=A0A0E0L0N9_ORYPU
MAMTAIAVARRRREEGGAGRLDLVAVTATNRRRRCGGIWDVKQWWWLAVGRGAMRPGTTVSSCSQNLAVEDCL